MLEDIRAARLTPSVTSICTVMDAWCEHNQEAQAQRLAAVEQQTADQQQALEREEQSLQQREGAAKVRMQQAQMAVKSDNLGKIEGPNRAPPGAKEGFTIEMQVRVCMHADVHAEAVIMD